MNDEGLIDAARTAAQLSYSPYSRFRVGAAVETESGQLYTGANVENAAFPSSSCAEAVTIQYAMSQGERRLPTVAVACVDSNHLDRAYPCGRCRQIMTEAKVERVLVGTGTGEFRVHSLAELLPYGFDELPD